ncbi:hypothetical protein [Vibrio vulnificus]|uniref:hypothetical protein n=1 Tax=Vibrio vulnificus TaxID=672 RepID=UPI0010344AA7|nr:hypothetical protein [Vibrio vulnificus]
MAKYEEVYSDWEYLFKKVACADDMTGAYVDSEDLDELLKKPTKATAKGILYVQIDYWFAKGIEYSSEHEGKSVFDLIEEYPRIADIAENYGIDLDDCPSKFVGNC